MMESRSLVLVTALQVGKKPSIDTPRAILSSNPSFTTFIYNTRVLWRESRSQSLPLRIIVSQLYLHCTKQAPPADTPFIRVVQPLGPRAQMSGPGEGDSVPEEAPHRPALFSWKCANSALNSTHSLWLSAMRSSVKLGPGHPHMANVQSRWGCQDEPESDRPPECPWGPRRMFVHSNQPGSSVWKVRKTPVHPQFCDTSPLVPHFVKVTSRGSQSLQTPPDP